MIKDELLGTVLGECGPAKFFKAATVLFSKYHDNSTALVANERTPDQQIYTVCLSHDPAPLQPNHVWLKGWGANEGVPEALESAGLVRLTGAIWETGYENAVEAELVLKKEKI